MSSDETPAVPPQPTAKDVPEPGMDPIRRYLLYSLSLPERVVRSGVGVVGGVAREATALLIPQAFQDSKTYHVMVRQTLNFLVENVGGVAAKEGQPPDAAQQDNFLARKAVGNFVDTAGLLVFHISPMAVLAILSDVAYGSRAYLQELAAELKSQGLIDEHSTINHVDDLLAAVAKASETTATAFDTPPLSLDGLKKTVQDTRDAVMSIDPGSILPQAELQRMWGEMRETATREDVSLLTVSGAMSMHALRKMTDVGKGTLTGVRVAGNLFNRHVVDHYRDALSDIRQKGLFATVAETSEPYIDAVWNNFSSQRGTLTEDALTGRLFVRSWTTVRGFFSGWKATRSPEPSDQPVLPPAESSTPQKNAPPSVDPSPEA
ncbi:MAG: hypothetical protein HYS13_25425 [Planctomycetia bacterium]|nr:hypothetical protein [Planctomycetia bacterium]